MSVDRVGGLPPVDRAPELEIVFNHVWFVVWWHHSYTIVALPTVILGRWANPSPRFMNSAMYVCASHVGYETDARAPGLHTAGLRTYVGLLLNPN